MSGFSSGRLEPIYNAGGVNINQRVDEHDMQQRHERATLKGLNRGRATYYPAPTGAYADSYRNCRVGEVSFTMLDKDDDGGAIMALIHGHGRNGMDTDPKAKQVPSVATLNLLGEESQQPGPQDDIMAREAILSRMDVHGFFISGNEDSRVSALTSTVGGIFTPAPNVAGPIKPGDWVTIHLPSRDELKTGAFNRGDLAAAVGGRVVPHLKALNDSDLELTPKNLYAAMQQTDAALYSAGFHTSYVQLVRALESSLRQIFSAVVEKVIDDDSWVKAREKIFQRYDKSAKKPLQNADGAAGIGKYLAACSALVRQTHRLIVGKALSGIRPKSGGDFDIAIMNPIR